MKKKTLNTIFKNVLIILSSVFFIFSAYHIVSAACGSGTATTADIKVGQAADVNCDGYKDDGTLAGSNEFHTGTQCFYATGDDYDLDGATKSYTDNGCGTGTVLDNQTGLCWEKTPDTNSWNNAVDDCYNLSLGGHSDWRLPNVIELMTMWDASCLDQDYGKECPSGNASECCGSATCEWDSGWGKYFCRHSWCYSDGKNNAFNWIDTNTATYASSTTNVENSSNIVTVRSDLWVYEYNDKTDTLDYRCVRTN